MTLIGMVFEDRNEPSFYGSAFPADGWLGKTQQPYIFSSTWP